MRKPGACLGTPAVGSVIAPLPGLEFSGAGAPSDFLTVLRLNANTVNSRHFSAFPIHGQTQGSSDLPALTREQTLGMTNGFLRSLFIRVNSIEAQC
jgi:hypothetical protein